MIKKEKDYSKYIIQNGHSVLRENVSKILVSDIKTAKIKNLVDKMKKTLASQDDGVGLAGPQIGESLAIFIISKRAFFDKNNAPKDDLVFINPEIMKLSKDKAWVEEGCLSVRPLFGKVKRSKKATIRAYDENGKKFEMGASGLIAQIFQHETDHLNGVLFIDKAEDVVEMPVPPKNN
ncbi:MAG: peptide deformylase [bacterium]|nr:peptide deformylase [bacterium]